MLPVLITLPGPGSVRQTATHVVDVEVLPAASPAPSPVADHGPETTAAIPTVEDAPPPETLQESGADADEPTPAEPGAAAATEISRDPVTTVRVPDAEPIPVIPAAASGQAEIAPAEEPSPQADGEASPAGTKAATEEAAEEPAEGLDLEPKTEAPAETETAPDASGEVEAPLDAKVPEKAALAPEAEAPSKIKPAVQTPVAKKKPSKTTAKRSAPRARRTRRVTTVPQGGVLQDLFGAPQRVAPSGGETSRSTLQR